MAGSDIVNYDWPGRLATNQNKILVQVHTRWWCWNAIRVPLGLLFVYNAIINLKEKWIQLEKDDNIRAALSKIQFLFTFSSPLFCIICLFIECFRVSLTVFFFPRGTSLKLLWSRNKLKRWIKTSKETVTARWTRNYVPVLYLPKQKMESSIDNIFRCIV